MNDEDWLKLEVEQVFQTIRSFLALQVQVLSVLLAANVTVIGFGVSQQSTGPFIVGCIISGMTAGIMLSMDSRIMSPIFYRAMRLKAKLGDDNLDFFPVFFGTFYYPELPERYDAISKVRDLKTKTKMLRGVFLRWRAKRYLFVAIAAILQLGLIPVLSLLFGWKFP